MLRREVESKITLQLYCNNICIEGLASRTVVSDGRDDSTK